MSTPVREYRNEFDPESARKQLLAQKRRPNLLHELYLRAADAENPMERTTIREFLSGLLSSPEFCQNWAQICQILVRLDHQPNPLSAMRAFAAANSRKGLRITAEALGMFDVLPNAIEPIFDWKLQQIRDSYKEEWVKPDTVLIKYLVGIIKPRFREVA